MCPGFDPGELANKPNIKDDAPKLLVYGLGVAEEYKLPFRSFTKLFSWMAVRHEKDMRRLAGLKMDCTSEMDWNYD
eukprot:9484054-Lingulodinium_polyedra.AAC.1